MIRKFNYRYSKTRLLFSLNDDLNKFEYNSIGGEFSINNFITSINFIEENGPVGNSNILENSLSYKIDEFNSFSLTQEEIGN